MPVKPAGHFVRLENVLADGALKQERHRLPDELTTMISNQAQGLVLANIDPRRPARISANDLVLSTYCFCDEPPVTRTTRAQ